MSYEQHVRAQDAQFLAALQSKTPQHDQVFLDEVARIQKLVQQIREVVR